MSRVRCGEDGRLQRLAVGTATALTAIHGAGVVHRDFAGQCAARAGRAPHRRFRHRPAHRRGDDRQRADRRPYYIDTEQLRRQASDQRRRHIRLGGDDGLRRRQAGVRRRQRARRHAPDHVRRAGHQRPAAVPAERPVLECLDKDLAQRPSARDLLLRLVDPSAPRTPAGPPADDLVELGPAHRVGTRHRTTFPGHVPTQLPVPGQAPARSRRTPILVAGGAQRHRPSPVLAVVLLTRGSPPTSPADFGAEFAGGQRQQPCGHGAQHIAPVGDQRGHGFTAFAGTWKGRA